MLNEASDRAPCYWNVFDAGSDDVALSHGDHVSDAIPGVNDDTSEGPVLCLPPGPAGGEGEDSLDGDVEAGHVETLEHDLGGVLSVLGGVERGLGEKEVVVLRLCSKVFENAMF